MTIEEAIRILDPETTNEELEKRSEKGDWFRQFEIKFNAEQKIINELRKRQWISVKDRLPEPAENVLIFTDYHGGCVDIGRYVLQGNLPFWARGGAEIKDNVTHWQPLPEPPKEVLINE